MLILIRKRKGLTFPFLQRGKGAANSKAIFAADVDLRRTRRRFFVSSLSEESEESMMPLPVNITKRNAHEI